MVWMGFTCIFLTNTFLVGRYWDFNVGCRMQNALVCGKFYQDTNFKLVTNIITTKILIKKILIISIRMKWQIFMYKKGFSKICLGDLLLDLMWPNLKLVRKIIKVTILKE